MGRAKEETITITYQGRTITVDASLLRFSNDGRALSVDIPLPSGVAFFCPECEKVKHG